MLLDVEHSSVEVWGRGLEPQPMAWVWLSDLEAAADLLEPHGQRRRNDAGFQGLGVLEDSIGSGGPPLRET